MKRISNRFIIFATICILVGIIAFKTFEKTQEEHNRMLIYAMQSKVEYKAKRCYIEGACKGEVTLKFLYEKGYLKEVVHPVSKEVIDENTSINYKDEIVTIKWLN